MAREYVDRLGNQGHPHDPDVISEQRCSFPRRLAPIHKPKLFSHGVNVMKVNSPGFNIIEPFFYTQYNFSIIH
jgi:hypothetical protein